MQSPSPQKASAVKQQSMNGSHIVVPTGSMTDQGEALQPIGAMVSNKTPQADQMRARQQTQSQQPDRAQTPQQQNGANGMVNRQHTKSPGLVGAHAMKQQGQGPPKPMTPMAGEMQKRLAAMEGGAPPSPSVSIVVRMFACF
jgi:hypothetical protein